METTQIGAVWLRFFRIFDYVSQSK